MRRPSATKALKTLSLIITIWMFCFSSPAARRIGLVYSRSNCSASVSRMTGGPLACCASADIGAMASETAVAIAVSFDDLDRPGIFAQQLLGLGIADDRWTLGLLRKR